MILNIKLLFIHLCDTNIGTVNTKDFIYFSIFFQETQGQTNPTWQTVVGNPKVTLSGQRTSMAFIKSELAHQWGLRTQNRFCEVRGSQTGAIPLSHFEAAP